MWLEIPVLFGTKWHESNVIMYKKSPKKMGIQLLLLGLRYLDTSR